MTHTTFYKALLGTVALTAISTGSAFAAGTQAGTNVQNTFTLDYEVNGTPQTQIDNNGAPTEFTVDRLVDLTVASQGNTNVAPGSQDQELVFTLTNDGNDTHAYALTTLQGTDGTDDDFDPANTTLFYVVDTNGNGIYEPGVDAAPVAYNGTNTPDVAPDATLFVIVQGDIDAAQIDGETSQIALIADTLDAGTTNPTIADADGVNTLIGGAENVLADAAGTDDAANQGDHSAQGTFIIASADVSASKTVTIFSQDGSNCGDFAVAPPAGEQFSVPGACVEYRIIAVNSGSQDATALEVNDQLPVDLTYVDSQVDTFTGGTLSEPASGLDCGPTLGNCTVNLSGATLAAGQAGVVIIRALIK